MQQWQEFIGNHPGLMAAFFAVLVFIVVTEIRVRRGPKKLSTSDAIRLMNDEQALVLDLRDPSEYSAGHIINARNLPIARFDGEIEKIAKKKDQTIIVYCKSGTQSNLAIQKLLKAGYLNISQIKNGIYAWQQDNLPLQK